MTNKGKGKPSDRRAGKRRDRNQWVGTRIPELGYYLIVTDMEETEKNYFEGLRDSIPAELKDHLVIKAEKAKTVELVKRAMELIDAESQYRIPWIVFDRDQVKDFDDIIKLAEKNDINAGWSNPCCDWFAEKFEKVTGQQYLKKDRNIYRKLVQYGDEEKAIEVAKQCYKKCLENGKKKQSEMWSVSMVYRLVGEIQRKLELF